jgi:hypothetical protein
MTVVCFSSHTLMCIVKLELQAGSKLAPSTHNMLSATATLLQAPESFTHAPSTVQAAGLISACIGLVMFLDGLRVCIMPLAEEVGQKLPQRLPLPVALVVAFVLVSTLLAITPAHSCSHSHSHLLPSDAEQRLKLHVAAACQRPTVRKLLGPLRAEYLPASTLRTGTGSLQ